MKGNWTEPVRIGTRKSKLALAQTELVIKALEMAVPGIQTEIVPIVSTGDKILGKPLLEFGGKGVFVAEFEEAIARGEIHMAVHSAKDLPMTLSDGLAVGATLKRADARDVLVTVKKSDLTASLSSNPFILGTGSLRRQLQFVRLHPDTECKHLRGNVNTRLDKLLKGEYDGIILAAAGLLRLGLLENSDVSPFAFTFLPEMEFIPAGGQGIIAVEAKADGPYMELLEQINDDHAMISLMAEREVLRLLEAGCNEAIGVYSWWEEQLFSMTLMRQSEEGLLRRRVSGNSNEYLKLAKELVEG